MLSLFCENHRFPLYDTIGNGFLLFGAPGYAKTRFLRMLDESIKERYPERSLFSILYPSDIISKYKGVAVTRIQAAFEEVKKYDKSIICIDGIDHLCPVEDDSWGDDVSNALLECIHNVMFNPDVMVICITNVPWLVSSRLTRGLTNTIFADLPDAQEFAANIRNFPDLSDAFGFDEAEKERLIDLIAGSLQEKSCTYYNLNGLRQQLLTLRMEKVKELYPNDSETLASLPFITEEMLVPILNGLTPPFDKAYYEKLKAFYHERTSPMA